MKVEEKSIKKLDVKAALDFAEQAQKAGRSIDEAFTDYLTTRGFSRPEENEAFMKKFAEENRELSERIKANLEQIRQIARAAQEKYTRF
ncbi:hypothetical protein HUU05_30010 [candidate division KSB1 bacterium]|nr:hypothetical protein [candidate division KSB1 bacterium]